MKGLILSGGKGTRLRPITHTAAKQLVPVANKPILYYAIEALRDAGIRDIGIIVGETREEVRAAVGDGSRWGARISYIQQEAPLGLAHAVKISEEFMAGESFVMYLGDNLIRGGIGDFVRQFDASRPDAMVLLAKVPDPSQFGVAELNGDGHITRLQEKPREPKSDLALVGVYLFTRAIFPAVHAIKPSRRGELEITDAIQYLVDDAKRVLPHVITGWWKDTGKLADMLEANRIMLDDIKDADVQGRLEGGTQIQGRVVVAPGSHLVDCTVRGPVVIGENCRLERTFVGPYTSIGPDVTITGTEIEHSIVLSGSRIQDPGARIVDSLLGKNVEVGRSSDLPRAFRLMLGDSSQVTIP
ncbi:MAG: glucose-1-phosphate thymidylyltransferase [Candidatus Sericytochromatia bacterium]|nr:glucose-1-phosphate thymidylyltransferase [Candidatus Tanganyikabacteria bacterium]